MQEIRLTLTALLLIFVTLKLTDHIDWSWWWVLVPFWGPLALWLVGLALQGIAWLCMTPQQRAARRAANLCRQMADAIGRNR